MPERLLVFLPGALVPTEHYRPTMHAVQKATTGVRLTVVIPAMTDKLCTHQCLSKSRCGQLRRTVDKVIKQSGFRGVNPKDDTFIAGHSLGSVCANYMVSGHGYEFAGLMAYGGYVDETGESSVANYSIPVLTMGGELDGGAARPGRLSLYYSQFKSYGAAHGDATALVRKPVHVLPGLDHSDFCPGFFVTAIKDLKSEQSQEEALEAIARGSSAFLQLNSPTAAETKERALSTMYEMQTLTAELLEPYLAAFALEQHGAAGPWCETAQQVVAGLRPEDAGKLVVRSELLAMSSFWHGHTEYAKLADGRLEATVISAVEPFTESHKRHGAAKSIDCKMLAADRIAEQLSLNTQAVQCREVNKLAVDVARKLMPRHALERFDTKGRGFCHEHDIGVLGDIGPLFVAGSLKAKETSECLEVASLGLTTSLKSWIYPGNHYCKLLSPAMALEWMMTDGLKPFPYDLQGDDAVDTMAV